MHGRGLSSEMTQVMETRGQKDRESGLLDNQQTSKGGNGLLIIQQTVKGEIQRVSSSSSTEVQIPKVVVMNKNTQTIWFRRMNKIMR